MLVLELVAIFFLYTSKGRRKNKTGVHKKKGWIEQALVYSCNLIMNYSVTIDSILIIDVLKHFNASVFLSGHHHANGNYS